ncbi:MAG: maleylpyruvate isomerase N-terminal domain-containing protein, partial [Actinomycetota bacterium]
MPPAFDARRVNDCVEGCATAHQQLLAIADGLPDDAFPGPSALPGWSRAHVVAHLALNARSHVGLFAAAARGE